MGAALRRSEARGANVWSICWSDRQILMAPSQMVSLMLEKNYWGEAVLLTVGALETASCVVKLLNHPRHTIPETDIPAWVCSSHFSFQTDSPRPSHRGACPNHSSRIRIVPSQKAQNNCETNSQPYHGGTTAVDYYSSHGQQGEKCPCAICE